MSCLFFLDPLARQDCTLAARPLQDDVQGFYRTPVRRPGAGGRQGCNPGAQAGRERTSMTYKIFIDGGAGTTGLEIGDRLSTRRDISVVTLPDAVRKDPSARSDALNSSD